MCDLSPHFPKIFFHACTITLVALQHTADESKSPEHGVFVEVVCLNASCRRRRVVFNVTHAL